MQSKRRIACFMANRHGVALVEFALVLPVLLLLLFASIEMARYAIFHLKLDKAVNAMSDFATQQESLRRADLNSFAQAIDEIMMPYSVQGTVIFTSISSTPPPFSDTIVNWQYKQLGNDASRIAPNSEIINLPGGYEIPGGQGIVAAELFLRFAPMIAITGNFIPALAPHTVYKAAIFKPRSGTLTELGD